MLCEGVCVMLCWKGASIRSATGHTCVLFAYACFVHVLLVYIKQMAVQSGVWGRKSDTPTYVMLHISLQVTTMLPLNTSITASLEC